MRHILSYIYTIEPTHEDFNLVLEAFVKSGWVSLPRIALTAIAKAIDKDRTAMPLRSSGTGLGSQDTLSDVFEHDGVIVILQLTFGPGTRLKTLGSLFGGSSSTKSALKATVIADSIIKACKVFVNANKLIYETLSLDPEIPGLITSGSSLLFDATIADAEERIRNIRESISYESPSMTDEEMAFAELLTDSNVREFVQRLSQVKTLSEAQYMEEISNLPEGSNFSRLALEHGMITRETLIHCLRNQRIIARVEQNDVDLASLKIRCTHCNRYYKDEKILNGYSISDKLVNLMQKSRWMNILVTRRLLSMGFDARQIFWNTNFGSEEIDIVASLNGDLLVFELKDTEFSASDAKHFDFRRSVLKANEAFIITTSRVSPDAREVFAHSSEGTWTLSSDSKLPMPHLVEGIGDELNSALLQIATRAEANAAWVIRTAFNGFGAAVGWVAASPSPRAPDGPALATMVRRVGKRRSPAS